MKHTFFIFTCTLLLHGIVNTVHAQVSTIWDTESLTSIKENNQPSMHSMALVWQAKGGLSSSASLEDWEIFAYDLQSGTVIQLTDDTFDDTLPHTDGTSIVWQKYVPGVGNQVFMYQLTGSNPPGGTQISTDGTGDNFSPNIVKGAVVWSRQQAETSFGHREVVLYTIGKNTGPVVISNPANSYGAPRIAADMIVFPQENIDGTETLFFYDVSADVPKVKPVPDDFTWHSGPQVDAGQRVLSRHNGADREIYLHNQTEGYVQLTDNVLSDLSPTVNQNHVAWVADNNIYLADIADLMHVEVPDDSSGRGTGFLATWSTLSGGVEAYFLDVSTDPDFRSFVEGFRTRDVDNVTQYWVEGLQPGTTYYYRVYASVNGSTTALSKSVPVKIFAPSSPPPAGSMAIPFIYKLLLE